MLEFARRTRYQVDEGQFWGKAMSWLRSQPIHGQLARGPEYRTSLLGRTWLCWVGYDQRWDFYTGTIISDEAIPALLAKLSKDDSKVANGPMLRSDRVRVFMFGQALRRMEFQHSMPAVARENAGTKGGVVWLPGRV